MQFEEILDKLWMADSEVFAHDCLFVFIKYKTKEKIVFHNSPSNELQIWLDKEKPILCMYNGKSYDKYILKSWLAGYSPEEIKKVNDYIICGGNGWEIDIPLDDYILPLIYDPLLEIVPRKSLKELEGNLQLNITETTISFDMPRKWNEEEYQQVLYYCTCDVEGLIAIFNELIVKYKSKYIIAKIGNIEPEYALSLTNTNLTALLLKAKRKEHNDYFIYEYPSVVDKKKIPKEFLDYIEEKKIHNDPNYEIEPPNISMDTINFQTGVGGGHAFRNDGTFIYDKEMDLKCD